MAFYRLLYRTSNFITLPIALVTATFTRFAGSKTSVLYPNIDALLLFGIIAWIAATSLVRYYEESLSSQSTKTLYSTTVVVLIFYSMIGVFSFIFKDADFSRLIITLFAVYQWIFALATHRIIELVIAHRSRVLHKKNSILIVGEEASTKQIVFEVERNESWNAHVVGYVCNIKGDNRTIPHLGSLGDVRSVITNWGIQELVITLPMDSQVEEIKRIMLVAEDEGIRVQIIPQNLSEFNIPLNLDYFGSIPTYRVRHVPLDDLFNQFVKRSFDVILSIIGLIAVSPLLIPIMLLIKVADGGSMLTIQKRTGHGQKDFDCYKLRSLALKKSVPNDAKSDTDSESRFLSCKLAFLPAIPLGELLRKTYIDELPQLINVIRGDMSLVGPRPHMVKSIEVYRELVDSYMLRHHVRPGITGLAQINGYRGKTESLEALKAIVHYDLKYVETWTLGLDIKILVKSFSLKNRKPKNPTENA